LLSVKAREERLIPLYHTRLAGQNMIKIDVKIGSGRKTRKDRSYNFV